MKYITCEYSIDTAYVELRKDGELIPALDCIAVEATVPRNRYERTALDLKGLILPLHVTDLCLFHLDSSASVRWMTETCVSPFPSSGYAFSKCIPIASAVLMEAALVALQ